METRFDIMSICNWLVTLSLQTIGYHCYYKHYQHRPYVNSIHFSKNRFIYDSGSQSGGRDPWRGHKMPSKKRIHF